MSQPIAMESEASSSAPLPTVEAETAGDTAAPAEVEETAEVTTLAVVPFGRRSKGKVSKASVLREKHLAEFQGKSAEECLAALQERLEAENERLKKLSEEQLPYDVHVDKARQELEGEKERVAEAILGELEAAKVFREARAKRAEATKRTEERRLNLLEAQKKIAMLQVVKMNHATMQKLQEQRLAAMKAAEEAKRNLLEHRMNEKRALEEATRKAVAPFMSKGGKKRKAEEALETAAEATAGAATEAAAGVVVGGVAEAPETKASAASEVAEAVGEKTAGEHQAQDGAAADQEPPSAEALRAGGA